jgi:hypothetical protein
MCFKLTYFSFFPKAMEFNLMKFGHMHWGMSPIVILFGDNIDDHSKSEYKMTMISTTKYPSIHVSLSHLFLWFANGIARLWCINFENMKVEWGQGLVAHKNVIEDGECPNCESLWQGESVSLCCNWNLASSSANTSFLKILVFVFIGHVLGTIG